MESRLQQSRKTFISWINIMSIIKAMNTIQRIISLIIIFICVVYLFEVNVLNCYKEPVEYDLGDEILGESIIGVVDNISIEFCPKIENLQVIRMSMTSLPVNEIGETEGTIVLEIYNKDKLLYRGSQKYCNIVVNTWVIFNVNLNLKIGATYTAKVYTLDTEIVPEMHYVSSDILKPALSFGYASTLYIGDKILYSLLVLLVTGICLFLIFNFFSFMEFIKLYSKKIYKNLKMVKPFSVFIIFFSLITTYNIGLETNIIIKIIITFILFLVSNWAENNFSVIKQFVDTTWKKIIIFIATFLMSFSLIGSRCFIYPVDMHITIGAVFIFLLTMIEMLPLVLFIIKVLDNILQKQDNFYDKRKLFKLIIICIVIIGVGAFYFIRAFNPAISSNDTMYCMYYAKNSMVSR